MAGVLKCSDAIITRNIQNTHHTKESTTIGRTSCFMTDVLKWTMADVLTCKDTKVAQNTRTTTHTKVSTTNEQTICSLYRQPMDEQFAQGLMADVMKGSDAKM